MCPARRRDVVFPLVQVHARLLSVQYVGQQRQPVHAQLHPFRRIAQQRLRRFRQFLAMARRHIVARDNRARVQ
jgi:hypothetical protein